jgi:hypothetical protein
MLTVNKSKSSTGSGIILGKARAGPGPMLEHLQRPHAGDYLVALYLGKEE